MLRQSSPLVAKDELASIGRLHYLVRAPRLEALGLGQQLYIYMGRLVEIDSAYRAILANGKQANVKSLRPQTAYTTIALGSLAVITGAVMLSITREQIWELTMRIRPVTFLDK